MMPNQLLKTLIVCCISLLAMAEVKAQTLEYPKRSDYCTKEERAKAAPDDLYSWCNDSKDEYYNECECRFEKALKRVNEQKKEIETDIKNLRNQYANESQLESEKSNKAIEIDRNLRESTSIESDKQKAISYLQEAIRHAETKLNLQTDIAALHRKIYSESSLDNGFANAVRRDIDSYKSAIERIRGFQKITKSNITMGNSNKKSSNSNSDTNTSSQPQTNNNSNSTATVVSTTQTASNSDLQARADAQRQAFEKQQQEFFSQIEQQRLELEQKNLALEQLGNTITNDLAEIFTGELNYNNIISISESLITSGVINDLNTIGAVGVGGGILAAGVGALQQAKQDKIKSNAEDLKDYLNRYNSKYKSFQNAIESNNDMQLLETHHTLTYIEDNIFDNANYLINKADLEQFKKVRANVRESREKRNKSIEKIKAEVFKKQNQFIEAAAYATNKASENYYTAYFDYYRCVAANIVNEQFQGCGSKPSLAKPMAPQTKPTTEEFYTTFKRKQQSKYPAIQAFAPRYLDMAIGAAPQNTSYLFEKAQLSSTSDEEKELLLRKCVELEPDNKAFRETLRRFEERKDFYYTKAMERALSQGGFSDGLAPIKFNEKYGFIDQTGKIVIPIKYDYEDAKSFSGGLAIVKQNGKYGYIDKVGEVVIPFKFLKAESFSEGLANVIRDDYYYAYIDNTGKEVFLAPYSKAGSFNEGLAWVALGEDRKYKYGFINQTGALEIPLKYSNATDFNGGFSVVSKNKFSLGGDYSEEKFGVINNKGEKVISFKYSAIENTGRGLFIVHISGAFMHKYGVLDAFNKTVIPIKYDDLLFLENGFFAKKKRKWGIIDDTGKEISPFTYDQVIKKNNRTIPDLFEVTTYTEDYSSSNTFYMNTKGECVKGCPESVLQER